MLLYTGPCHGSQVSSPRTSVTRGVPSFRRGQGWGAPSPVVGRCASSRAHQEMALGQAACWGRGFLCRCEGPQFPCWGPADAASAPGPRPQASPVPLATSDPTERTAHVHSAGAGRPASPPRLGGGCTSWLRRPLSWVLPTAPGALSLPHTLLLEPAPFFHLPDRVAWGQVPGQPPPSEGTDLPWRPQSVGRSAPGVSLHHTRAHAL